MAQLKNRCHPLSPRSSIFCHEKKRPVDFGKHSLSFVVRFGESWHFPGKSGLLKSCNKEPSWEIKHPKENPQQNTVIGRDQHGPTTFFCILGKLQYATASSGISWNFPISRCRSSKCFTQLPWMATTNPKSGWALNHGIWSWRFLFPRQWFSDNWGI